MFENKVTLTPQDILEKEFKIDTRGYRLKEVDQFLDIVIGDYEELFKIIREQNEEKEKLLQEIMSLKQEIRNLKSNLEAMRYSEKEVTNVDLIRRVSQLEKIILGKENN